jgi:hypothetical protein
MAQVAQMALGLALMPFGKRLVPSIRAIVERSILELGRI